MAEQKKVNKGYTPRLQTKYMNEIRQLFKEFSYKSEMQIPKIEKITLNMGLGEAVSR